MKIRLYGGKQGHGSVIRPNSDNKTVYFRKKSDKQVQRDNTRLEANKKGVLTRSQAKCNEVNNCELVRSDMACDTSTGRISIASVHSDSDPISDNSPGACAIDNSLLSSNGSVDLTVNTSTPATHVQSVDICTPDTLPPHPDLDKMTENEIEAWGDLMNQEVHCKDPSNFHGCDYTSCDYRYLNGKEEAPPSVTLLICDRCKPFDVTICKECVDRGAHNAHKDFLEISPWM